jgi:integrase
MAADTFARQLTDAAVRNAKPKDKPYKLPDGGGMYLLVNPNGAKLWRYKFRLNAVEGLDALGAYPEVNLSAAREAHRVSRGQVDAGLHPVHHRKAERERRERERQAADEGEFVTVMTSWRELTDVGLAANTINQREREIKNHLVPEFKGRHVASITRVEWSKLLKRVMGKTPEVARNLRTYACAMYEHAMDTGVAQANPVPPPRSMKPRQVVNHAAMDAGRVGAFLVALQQCRAEPATKLAMQLVLWGITRKVEATGARWEEFSLDDEAGAAWDVPAERMKARLPHWVPLPRQAVTALREFSKWSTGEDHLFPNRRDPSRAMAGNSLNMLLQRLGYDEDATIHGFRALFSTRYNAQGPQNADVVERCLAHAPKDKVRAAYNRHQYADERRAMLQDWADWLDAQVAAVPERLVA